MKNIRVAKTCGNCLHREKNVDGSMSHFMDVRHVLTCAKSPGLNVDYNMVCDDHSDKKQ